MTFSPTLSSKLSQWRWIQMSPIERRRKKRRSQGLSKSCFFTLVSVSVASLQFIQYHVAGFYKPTIPPSHLWDYSTCNKASIEFSTIFVPSFDPNEWCLKNGLCSGGLNPGPLGHESSALTTRSRLFALVCPRVM